MSQNQNAVSSRFSSQNSSQNVSYWIAPQVIGAGFVVIKVVGKGHSEDSEEMNIFNAMGLSALPTEVELAPYNIDMSYLSPRQRSYFLSTRVACSDSHPALYVVSPWWNMLDPVLFGPWRTGLALRRTHIQGWITVWDRCRYALEIGCLPPGYCSSLEELYCLSFLLTMKQT